MCVNVCMHVHIHTYSCQEHIALGEGSSVHFSTADAMSTGEGSDTKGRVL